MQITHNIMVILLHRIILEPRLLLPFCSAIPRAPPFSNMVHDGAQHNLAPGKRIKKREESVYLCSLLSLVKA